MGGRVVARVGRDADRDVYGIGGTGEGDRSGREGAWIQQEELLDQQLFFVVPDGLRAAGAKSGEHGVCESDAPKTKMDDESVIRTKNFAASGILFLTLLRIKLIQVSCVAKFATDRVIFCR